MSPHTIKLSFHGLLHGLSKSGIMLSWGLRTVPSTVRRLNLIVWIQIYLIVDFHSMYQSLCLCSKSVSHAHKDQILVKHPLQGFRVAHMMTQGNKRTSKRFLSHSDRHISDNTACAVDCSHFLEYLPMFLVRRTQPLRHEALLYHHFCQPLRSPTSLSLSSTLSAVDYHGIVHRDWF